jgi:CheY-like chemotaxis protein
VVLAAAVQQRDARTCRLAFEVRDTGIGIPHDRLDRLFSSFSQADASISRQYGGTGLGLAIASRLVRLLGGEISVESEPGRGTQFRFSVSMALADRPAPSPALTEPRSVGRLGTLRVLVAEDQTVNQVVAVRLLERLGVTADLAVNGALAVEAALKTRYDLVLMDVEMPDVDGLEATRTIRRALPPDVQPVIVGLTAHATAEYRERCLNAGMNASLIKPIEPTRLKDLLAELLAPAEAGEAVQTF